MCICLTEHATMGTALCEDLSHKKDTKNKRVEKKKKIKTLLPFCTKDIQYRRYLLFLSQQNRVELNHKNSKTKSLNPISNRVIPYFH